MLNRLPRNPWLRALIGFALGIVLIAAFSFFFDVSGEICTHAEETNKPECGGHNLALVFLWKIIKTLDAGSALITAIATAVLTWVTYLLVKLAREQSEATSRQLAISGTQADVQLKQQQIERLQFLTMHRPRIILRDVSLIAEDGVQKILYSLVNSGGTKAIIVESWIFAEWPAQGSAIRNPLSRGHDDLGRVEIPGGGVLERDYIVPDSITWYASLKVFTTAVLPLHFAGAILYEDDLGNRRRSVFRRIHRPDTDRFERTTDPDQEYAD